MTDALTTAFTSISTDVIGGLTAIAPIALKVMGAYFVWRYGVKFFKGLAR